MRISAAVEELLEVLEPAPKAFVLYFNCIDDFLGTDEKALLRELKSRFPGLHFTVCHINPVAADEKISQGMRKHNQMYELLEYTEEKDEGINLKSAIMFLLIRRASSLTFWRTGGLRQYGSFLLVGRLRNIKRWRPVG